MVAKIVFGAATFGTLVEKADHTPEYGKEILAVLEKNGVQELDTAWGYPGSEKALGELGAPISFTIHTKAPSFVEKSLSRDSIFAGIEKSLAELGVESVQSYLFHQPDKSTPLKESLSAINDLHKAGKFKEFGLSNHTVVEITEIHSLCTTNSWVLPTLYQGLYNPASRHIEEDMFPVLRSLNIKFFAYSPLAAGFLTKSPEFVKAGEEGTGGRWDKGTFLGRLYRSLYNKPVLVNALNVWEKISRDSGISKAALAYRWVAHSSFLDGKKGDAMVVGAGSVRQLEETLEAIRGGPLDEEIVRRIDEWFDLVKDDAPYDNMHPAE